MRFFRFLKITDSDNTLSLTSIALAVAVALVAVSATWPTIVALALILVNYNAKKYFAVLKASKEAGDITRIVSLEVALESFKKEVQRIDANQSFRSLNER